MNIWTVLQAVPVAKGGDIDIKLPVKHRGKDMLFRITSREATDEAWPCVYVKTSRVYEKGFTNGIEITWSGVIKGMEESGIFTGVHFKEDYFLSASEEMQNEYILDAANKLAELEG